MRCALAYKPTSASMGLSFVSPLLTVAPPRQSCHALKMVWFCQTLVGYCWRQPRHFSVLCTDLVPISKPKGRVFATSNEQWYNVLWGAL